MNFKRRVPLTKMQKTRETLWPSMGWWRVVRYYRVRIIRLSSPVHSIAVNLAAGAAMSFTPFFGIHIFGAMGIAWAMGAGMNIVAAVVGSFMGNPWTFPIFLYLEYTLGAFILEQIGFLEKAVDMDPDFVEKQGDGLWDFLVDNFHDIFLPTALGGIILAVVSFPIYYYIFFYLVKSAQRARKLRLKRKQMKAFRKAAKEPKK